MRIKLPARVTNLRSGSEYTKDYSKRVEFTESTLRILDNELHIEGSITVREELAFGSICQVAIDTTLGIAMVARPASVADFEPEPAA